MDLKEVENTCVCELERNFEFTEEIEEKLKCLGGEFIKSVILTDSYYDTEEFVLCLNDYWLRHRNGGWELKYRPLRVDESWQGSSDVSKYLEESDVNSIKQNLRDLFETNGVKSASRFLENEHVEHCTLDRCLSDLKLSPFASFTTWRTIYHCDDLTVNLDKTDFGCLVGEVEVTTDVKRQQQQQQSSEEEMIERRIETFGRKLGIQWAKTSGKLETYLIKNNPELYQKLLEAKILPKN